MELANKVSIKQLKERRMAGVLMPVASLPSVNGVGGFGQEAYQFVDILADFGMKIWQILPLNPLGYGNSPYQPFSSYAGDGLYIDLDILEKEGYLPREREPYKKDRQGRIDYPKAREYKETYLRRAYESFWEKDSDREEFKRFRETDWVYPYAVFAALKKQNGMRCWNEWPKEQRDWILDKKYNVDSLKDEIQYQIFQQYIFIRQWRALKSYANQKGILIMGDIPFYVGTDSLDVWGERSSFLMDKDGRPRFIAGVPPDYFSKTGQRWGNPIYDWEHIQKEDFAFWLNRIRYNCKLYDIIRIDHFRAFDTYWKIPAACETAVDGEWIEAPGYALFDKIYGEIPDVWIVAEDLGDLRPEVLMLRDHYHLMGMNVAQFTMADSAPREMQLAYTGTHDNQTAEGWYQELDKKRKRQICRRLRLYGSSGEGIARKMVRFVMMSRARLAIIPLGDMLGLGGEARLNTPGTVGSPNWEWCMEDWEEVKKQREWIVPLLRRSGRI